MSKQYPYTEAELVGGCLANDRVWQERLYRRYFPVMMEMCLRRTGDPAVAMTIVNDGLLRVFHKIHLFGFKGSLEGWIRRLVWHRLADHFRDQRRYVHFLVLEDRDEPVAPEAGSRLEVEDLMQAVQRLPARSADVFRLYAIEGYNHAEIAAQLGFSEGNSKWHLSVARRMLRELLQQEHKESAHYAG